MIHLPRLIVDLVTDPVCPWCYVGLKSYQQTQENLRRDFELITRLRPYTLNPNTPEKGVDREEHYARKFPDPTMRAQMRDTLVNAAKEAGFDFDPGRPTHLPNTLSVHRVLRWAHFEGKHETLAAMIYQSFWDEGGDIGDIHTLADLSANAGMDRDSVANRLATGEDTALVSQEADAMRASGVTGVPTFIVNERAGFSGALQPAALEKAIRQGAEAYPLANPSH